MDGMALLYFLVIGLAAGWIAAKLMDSPVGLLGSLIVGIIGAFIGGQLFSWLGIQAGGLNGGLVAATAGAIVLLFVVRLLKRA